MQPVQEDRIQPVQEDRIQVCDKKKSAPRFAKGGVRFVYADISTARRRYAGQSGGSKPPPYIPVLCNENIATM